jgi:Flp pilus assembly protein TadD
MSPSPEDQHRAQQLHTEAQEAADEELALAKYAQALALDPNRPDSLYNVGLIHKYRGAWRQSVEFNRRARELRPDDEATNWNVAIAAKALRDWRTAREVWNTLGMKIPLGADLSSANTQ